MSKIRMLIDMDYGKLENQFFYKTEIFWPRNLGLF